MCIRDSYSADLVGAERKIVLGKKSGLVSVKLKAEELGLKLPESAHAEALARVKELGTSQGRLITDDEFREIARAVVA